MTFNYIYSFTLFWQNKFDATVKRDAENHKALRAAGWAVIVLWECGIKKRPVDTVVNALIENRILDDELPWIEL